MSILQGPGEGTWSVFAEKVVQERDKLQVRVEQLEAELSKKKDLIQNLFRLLSNNK